MSSQTDASSIIGRKVFFVGFDVSMLPEHYLEDYLAHGYETYRIADDHICDIQYKVELIAQLYKGSIVLFYIDSPIDGTSWTAFIGQLLKRHRNDIYAGIFFSKRSVSAEQQEIENYYVGKLNVPCGCTALSYQRAQNFLIIDRLLAANNANGRRKTVRAFCSSNSGATFFWGTERLKASLKDISLNHFSCIFETQPEDEMTINQKFGDVQLLVNGSRFHANAMLAMQRDTPQGKLHVFMLIRPDGNTGLVDEDYAKLCPQIYQMVTDPTKNKLREAYFIINKQKGDVYTVDEVVNKAVQEMKVSGLL